MEQFEEPEEVEVNLSGAILDVLSKEIRSYVLDPYNKTLPVDKLCKKYNCKRSQILTAKNKVIMSIPKDNAIYARNKMKLLFDRLEKDIEELLDDEFALAKERRENIKLALELMREKTDYLERFQIKEKAPDKVQISMEKELIIDYTKPVDTTCVEVNEKLQTNNTE